MNHYVATVYDGRIEVTGSDGGCVAVPIEPLAPEVNRVDYVVHREEFCGMGFFVNSWEFNYGEGDWLARAVAFQPSGRVTPGAP